MGEGSYPKETKFDPSTRIDINAHGIDQVRLRTHGEQSVIQLHRETLQLLIIGLTSSRALTKPLLLDSFLITPKLIVLTQILKPFFPNFFKEGVWYAEHSGASVDDGEG